MNKLAFILSWGLALFGQSAVPIVYSIPIQNASFEAPAGGANAPDSCGTQWFGVPGWSSTVGASSIYTVVDASQCTFSPPPDGKSVAILTNPQTISQDLGDIYALLPHNSSGDVEGVLKLKFFIANRYYWYDGHYTVSLSLKQIATGPPSDTATLCSNSGIAAGDFTEIPLICPEQRVYGELFLNLSSTSQWDVVADNVSLTFTPTN